MGDRPMNPYVYIGVWTNWSYGSISGSTLTLTRSNGNLVIATLTLFVTLVGNCSWKLICFALHTWFSSNAPRDGLHHQRQAILRTSGTGIAGLWNLGRITWAWRKRARNPYGRMASSIGLAISIVSLFGVAGVFSSRLSRAMDDEALLAGKSCGFIDFRAISNGGQAALNPWISQVVSSSSGYARRCYEQEFTRQMCPAFMRAKPLPKTDKNATCPFDDRICKSRLGNLRLDTGFLNSHYHLGMNAPEEERFLYRRVNTCAPLKTEGYTTNFSTADGQNSIGFFYGFGLNRNINNAYAGTPLTYFHTTQRHLDNPDCFGSNLCEARRDYDLAFAIKYAGQFDFNQSTFEPIPELHQDDADVSLYFVSVNDVVFVEQVDDPIYSAHHLCGKDVVEGLSSFSNLYCRDGATNVLACTHQHQFCDATRDPTRGCFPLRGLFATRSNLSMMDELVLSVAAAKAATLVSLLSYGGVSALDVVSILGTSALTAREHLSIDVSGPLPDDQWQREVQHWDLASIATIERQIFETVNGPSNQKLGQYVRPPKEDFEKKFCRNQKVVSTDHVSFSIFRLSLILSIGGIIITVSYSVEFITQNVQKRKNSDGYGRLEWVANDTLQLQRLAHEELGFGTWSKTNGSYPVTQRGDLLAMLDVSDGTHPRLTQPPRTYKNNMTENTTGSREGPEDGKEEEGGGTKGGNAINEEAVA